MLYIGSLLIRFRNYNRIHNRNEYAWEDIILNITIIIAIYMVAIMVLKYTKSKKITKSPDVFYQGFFIIYQSEY